MVGLAVVAGVLVWVVVGLAVVEVEGLEPEVAGLVVVAGVVRLAVVIYS